MKIVKSNSRGSISARSLWTEQRNTKVVDIVDPLRKERFHLQYIHHTALCEPSTVTYLGTGLQTVIAALCIAVQCGQQMRLTISLKRSDLQSDCFDYLL